ncbi:hypothetical protein [Pseudomonas prosekii]|uniref:hypothetical protein n=1 Tax=Pseudomonas prosekii TaxID=1148509 RepID=UPI0011EB8C4B|nr:hypothetical protein [Pseudomonas prosekii]
MIEDIQQDLDVNITLGQFIQFLTDVERSSRCPVCPHDGIWNFYIDKSVSAGMQSPMAITRMISTYAVSPQDTYPVFTMECPNCGHMIYTNAHAVAKKIKAWETTDE